MSDKTLVNALWLGQKTLGTLELMTIHSFTSYGAEFHLWHYEPLNAEWPKGLVLRDGNEILPKEKIFRYPHNMILGFGHGSYVGFSEIFRYKVLYEKGGWWSDMDVTCLKPLDEITDDYWFRFHAVLSVVGNIMKVPPKSELMRHCYDRAVVEVNSEQRDWHHAIRILCYYIEFFGLSKYIHYDACNLDRLDFVNPYIYQVKPLSDLPSTWRFVHWMNSVIGKNFESGSIMEQLYNQYVPKPKAMFL
jgi:hypothetical protein